MKPRRAIGRIVIRAGIFLLLGAIVNIVVAWGCALWSLGAFVVDPQFFVPCLAGTAECSSATQSAFGETTVMVIHTKGLRELPTKDAPPIRELVPSWVSDDRLNHVDDYQYRYYQARGWPCLGLWCVQEGLWHTNKVSTRGGWQADWMPRSRRWPTWPHALPLRLIVVGFAINTLFYAAILWLLFAAPFTLRRRWRIKRGLCPACAYPIGTSDVCTECGKPVKFRSVETAPS